MDCWICPVCNGTFFQKPAFKLNWRDGTTRSLCIKCAENFNRAKERREALNKKAQVDTSR